MCYGTESTHAFDSSGHDWKHRSWSRLFRCTKCELTAHARNDRDSKPYACDLIPPEGWGGSLDCASLLNRLLVMNVMRE